MRSLLWTLTVLAIGLRTNDVTAQEVTLKKNPHSVKATIGDDVFAVFQFDENRKKPFILPVTAPGGFDILQQAEATNPPGASDRRIVIADETPQFRTEIKGQPPVFSIGQVYTSGEIQEDWIEIPELHGFVHRGDIAPFVSTVTRLINDHPEPIKDRTSELYYDHPHHKGVWFSVDEINGIKFWNEDGRIENQSFEVVEPSGNPAVLKTVNHWLGTDGKPLLEEAATISVYKNRLLTYDVTLTAVANEVEIGDTKEGMFAIRLPNSMREMVAGGPVINSDGVEGTKAAWGRTANWVDYKGPIDGHVFGVTLMDHPGNPWQSRYHVRDYGLFGVNPFGAGAYTQGRDDAQEAHHRVLKSGENLHFKYGLYVHSGETTNEDINTVFMQFAEN